MTTKVNEYLDVDERRAELIEMLRSASDQSSTTVALFRPADARDIRAMLKEGEEVDAPAPTITFRPYEPPKPTLDQMPEGEPHRCLSPMGYEVLALRVDDYAARVWPDRPSHISHRYPGYSGKYTVLDADPPQPKTLADVPAKCWCLDSNGNPCFHTPKSVTWPCGDPPMAGGFLPNIKIIRVLGFPQID